MAGSLIESVFISSPLKIIDDATGLTCWRNIKTLMCEIFSETRMADNPFATSAMNTQSLAAPKLQADLSSGKIITPSRIQAKFITDDPSIIYGVMATFADVKHQLTITSKEIVSRKMSMVDCRIKQAPDAVNAVHIDVTFEQSGTDSEGGNNPAQAGDQDAYGVHVIGSQGLLSSVQSLYNKTSSFLGV